MDTVSCGGGLVVAVKFTLVCPEGTLTLAGQVFTDVLLQLSVTTAPPLGAGSVSVTVPVVLLPPTTGFGLKVRFWTMGGGVPQTLATPSPPQSWGEAQSPQAIQPPQPSSMAPQFLPCAAQVVCVHPPPQTFALPPPPQVAGAPHVPQVTVPPQPSEIEPQFLPRDAQVTFAQAGSCITNR